LSKFEVQRLILPNVKKQRGNILNNKYSPLYLKVKGDKSRLLTDLIRLVGRSPSGIGNSFERAEVIAKDNKYQLIASLCVDFMRIPQNTSPFMAGMNAVRGQGGCNPPPCAGDVIK
jgi:hypothetical protein